MTRSAGRPSRLSDGVVAAALVIAGVGLPALLAAAAGALLVPHNDDFGYRRTAETLYATGRYVLTGWSAMTLVGQVLFAQPFLWLTGGGPAGIAAAAVVLASAGIAAAYAVARAALPRGDALFAVLALLAIPGVLRYTPTFMTDIPALSAELLCLAVGLTVLRLDGAGRWWRLAAAVAIGVFAFSIREYGLAAPLAVIVGAFASDPRRRTAPYLVAGVSLLAACGVMYEIVVHLPNQFPPLFVAPSVEIPRDAAGLATLAFMLGPAVVLVAARWAPVVLRDLPPRSSRHRAVAMAATVVGVAAAVIVVGALVASGGSARLLIGTVFGPPGTPDGQVLAGSRPALYGRLLWVLVRLASVVLVVGLSAAGAAIVAGRWPAIRAAVDLRRRPSSLGSPIGVVATFAALSGLGTFGVGAFAQIFDRYLWPAAFALSVVLLSVRPARSGTPSWLAGWAVLGAEAVLAVMLLLNSVAFDAAKWRAGEAEVAAGVPATAIDAGFEWVGMHATSVADLGAPLPAAGTRYTRLWSSYRQCVVISSSRLTWPGVVLEGTIEDAYRELLFIGPRRPFYIYRGSDCP